MNESNKKPKKKPVIVPPYHPMKKAPGHNLRTMDGTPATTSKKKPKK